MNRKHFKKIVAMITMLALIFTMNISAFAETVPVIDMGTFHNIYNADPSPVTEATDGILSDAAASPP